MSPLVTLLVLTAIAALLMRRRDEPVVVDRVAAFGIVMAGATPRFSRSLPGEPAKAAETLQRIGRVAIVAKMTSCDDVTRGPFYTDRDFGDEDDARGPA